MDAETLAAELDDRSGEITNLDQLNTLFSMPVSELRVDAKTLEKLEDFACVGDLVKIYHAYGLYHLFRSSIDRYRRLPELNIALAAIGLHFGMIHQFQAVKKAFDWENNPPDSVRNHVFRKLDEILSKCPRGMLEQIPQQIRDTIDRLIAPYTPDIDGTAFLLMPVDELGLSVRPKNALFNMQVRTIYDLTRLTDVELLHQPNFGRKSLNEVKERLAVHGLTLAPLS